MHKRMQMLMLAGALSASVMGCGAGAEDGQELLGETQQSLDTNYPARVLNCSNCADAGTYVDMNAGASLKFLNVNGGSGGAAKLRFSTMSPSGARTMGVFVNGAKVGTVTTTTLRPTLAEGPTAGITATLLAGTGNTVELRDSEGSAEPDVSYLKVTTGSSGPVCGNGASESGEQCDDGNTTSGDGCSSTCQLEAVTPVQISASAGVGGKISPNGTVTVNRGSSKTFTFSPDPDMRVSSVCYPNASTCFAHSSNSWTLPNAQSGQSVSVQFDYVPGAACGDNVCNNRETPESCPADCAVFVRRETSDTLVNTTLKSASQATSGTYLDGNQGAVIGYSANVPAGVYRLTFVVQSPSGLRKMGVFVNNVKVGVIASSVPYWNWQDISIDAALNKGNNTIELRDSEGTAELDVDYFQYETSNEVLLTRDGAIPLGWATENGRPVMNELVTWERPSYLSPNGDGQWIIDIFAYTESGRGEYVDHSVSLGLYVRDCFTGEWVNSDDTLFINSNQSDISDGEHAYSVQYFPQNATFLSSTQLLDSHYVCTGTGTPETVQVNYQGTPRIVLEAGFEQFALVVKHY